MRQGVVAIWFLVVVIEFFNLGKGRHILVQTPHIEKRMPDSDSTGRETYKSDIFGKKFFWKIWRKNAMGTAVDNSAAYLSSVTDSVSAANFSEKLAAKPQRHRNVHIFIINGETM